MTVKELNQNEFYELKSAYFYSDNYNENIAQKNGTRAIFPEDIPNEIIFDAFQGIDFVKEDFFCNINQ